LPSNDSLAWQCSDLQSARRVRLRGGKHDGEKYEQSWSHRSNAHKQAL